MAERLRRGPVGQRVGCSSEKETYSSPKEALKVMNKRLRNPGLEERFDHPRKVYRCSECGKYHFWRGIMPEEAKHRREHPEMYGAPCVRMNRTEYLKINATAMAFLKVDYFHDPGVSMQFQPNSGTLVIRSVDLTKTSSNLDLFELRISQDRGEVSCPGFFERYGIDRFEPAECYQARKGVLKARI